MERQARSCYNRISDRSIFIHGATSNFPSVGLRFHDRQVTLSQMRLSTEVSHERISLTKEAPRDRP